MRYGMTAVITSDSSFVCLLVAAIVVRLKVNIIIIILLLLNMALNAPRNHQAY